MDPFIEARQLARKLKAVDEDLAKRQVEAVAKKSALRLAASPEAAALVDALLKIPGGTQTLEPQAGEEE